jgi:hypothetical protein
MVPFSNPGQRHQEFSRKTNHKDANKARKGGMKQRFIPSFCALVRLGG